MIAFRTALTSMLIAAALVAGSVLASPARAADCPICDQYTLDIPDPEGKDRDPERDSGGSSDNAPELPAAPVASAPAAPAPAPVAEPQEAPKPKPERKRKRREPEPAAEPVVVSEPEPPTSEPLEYQEASASSAALSALGQPGTLALLTAVALFAGAAGLRRS